MNLDQKLLELLILIITELRAQVASQNRDLIDLRLKNSNLERQIEILKKQ